MSRCCSCPPVPVLLLRRPTRLGALLAMSLAISASALRALPGFLGFEAEHLILQLPQQRLICDQQAASLPPRPPSWLRHASSCRLRACHSSVHPSGLLAAPACWEGPSPALLDPELCYRQRASWRWPAARGIVPPARARASVRSSELPSVSRKWGAGQQRGEGPGRGCSLNSGLPRVFQLSPPDAMGLHEWCSSWKFRVGGHRDKHCPSPLPWLQTAWGAQSNTRNTLTLAFTPPRRHACQLNMTLFSLARIPA